MRYRPEIDGLRAVAVVPVILFHGGFELFSGGFVGVDVFFVISGYLITSIIINEMASGTLSLVNFWERRARRILPALFVMVLACLPFAWLWFTPSDFRSFSESMVAVSTFWSNFLFWKESGYFDIAAELKPLLHTWSLAVEEQYYIIFPVFLLVIWQLGKLRVLQILALFFVASLAMAHWGSDRFPAATFFLPHTRTWELLLGAFVAFFLQSRPDWGNQPASPLVQFASLTGLALIGYAVFAFDHQTPFPSLYALVPTVGTALVILFAIGGSFTKRVLSLGPLVGIGLISYSAYLWHQPVFAFVKYKSFGEPSVQMMALLCALTVPLAYLSWRFVEQPFRNKGRFNRQAIFKVCGATAGCLIALGLLGMTKNDHDPAVLAQFGPKSSYDGPASVLLLGDSHAEHLSYGLDYKLGTRVLTQWGAGCIPLFDVDRYDSRFEPGACAKAMREVLTDFENNDSLETLVLSTMGPVYLDGTTFRDYGAARVEGLGVELVSDKTIKDHWQVFEIGLRNTLQRLTALPNKNIIFTLDVPELGIHPRLCGVYKSKFSILGTEFAHGAKNFDTCIVSRQEYEHRVARYHTLVRDVLLDFPSVHLFDPTDLFCDQNRCVGAINGTSLYRDGDHLSEIGSLHVANKLAPKILEVSK